jgi:UDP-2,4-diacetamido-2,4,6-trideoxy-beta-L-altropyranose hydrolase
MTKTSVVVRTNGSSTIGLGHVRRCLTLGQALRDKFGTTVTFILNEDRLTQELVRTKGFASFSVTSAGDAEQTRYILKDLAATALVIDSYELDSGYLSSMQGQTQLLVAIDDLADKHFPVDLIINGAPNASHASYSALPTTRLLLGPSYALLRNEFSQEPEREFRGSISRALITVGGSDHFELTPRLLDWAQKALEKAALDVIVGPFFQNDEAIKSMAARLPVKVTLHFATEDIRTLMLEADIAVTGGGQTAYELAATATPALAICLAENQRSNLAGLEREGTLINAGDALAHELPEKIRSVLRDLDTDVSRRRKMGTRGRQLIDGLGAERVARAIIEATGSGVGGGDL